MSDMTQFELMMSDMMLTSVALAMAKQTLDEGGIIDLFDAVRGYVSPTAEERLDMLTEEGIPLWIRKIAPY